MAHNPELTKFEPCDFPVPDEAVEWAKKRGRKEIANIIDVNEFYCEHFYPKISLVSVVWQFWHKNSVDVATLNIKDDCSVSEKFFDDLPF
jgi:hypothetical protein